MITYDCIYHYHSCADISLYFTSDTAIVSECLTLPRADQVAIGKSVVSCRQELAVVHKA